MNKLSQLREAAEAVERVTYRGEDAGFVAYGDAWEDFQGEADPDTIIALLDAISAAEKVLLNISIHDDPHGYDKALAKIAALKGES